MNNRFLERVRDIVGSRDLGNGTSLADATFNAIKLEAEALQITADRVSALSDEEILSTSNLVHAHLNESRIFTPGRLAFGSEITSSRGIDIGKTVYRADAGRPGLHACRSLQDDPSGPNLERLFALLEPVFDDPLYAQFAGPKVSSVNTFSQRYFLEFAPYPPTANIILKRRLSDCLLLPPFCSWMPRQMSEFIDEVASNLNRVVYDRWGIAERADQIDRAWEYALAAVADGECSLQITSISIDFEESNGEYPDLLIEYDGLDERLRPSRIAMEISGLDEIDGNYFQHVFESQSVKFRRKRQLADLGRFLMKDSLAASISGSDFSLSSNHFSLLADLPSSVSVSAPGRRLSSIFELPFSCEADIVGVVENEDKRRYFKIKGEAYLIDLCDATIGNRPIDI